jgi:hypothetical protein
MSGITGELYAHNDLHSLAHAIRQWTAHQFPADNIRAQCHRIVDRFWNPDSRDAPLKGPWIAVPRTTSSGSRNRWKIGRPPTRVEPHESRTARLHRRL